MNYISYASHTDFFEIYNVIRDHMVTADPKERPMLNIALDEEKRRRSILQKAIKWAYERSQSPDPTHWQDNDRMLESLYEMTERLENSAINSSITIDQNAFKFSVGADLQYRGFILLAMNKLYYYFMKCGYLRKENDNRFTLAGNLSETDSGKDEIFLAEQREFNNEFRKFTDLATRYGNMFSAWLNMGESFKPDLLNTKWTELENILNPIVNISGLIEHRDSFYNMVSGRVPVYQTEKLQQMANDISSTNELFVRNSYMFLASIIEKKIGDESFRDI